MAADPVPSPTSAAYWDEVGEAWTDGHVDALWRAYCDRRNGSLIARWMDHTNGRILKTDSFDEAVSNGVYDVLRAHATRVTTIDVSATILRAARARHGTLTPALADVRRLPYADGAFDVVVSISTLDHFESVDAIRVALGELARVLRSGGGLLVTLDNPVHPTVALRNRLPFELLHRMGVVPYRVGATCGGATLRRLLTAAGLEVRELTWVEHCPRWVAVRAGRALGGSTVYAGTFMRVLERFEALERWPLRALTGHYVAAWAVKP